ncbi:hypothetical protein Q9L58_008699 [Maublancomyces gigas]|uniref:Uncharacterized protein n=1 Tax=Discina gigas TaxID=1032678 RepID=A0ABR3G8X9_9PEZI
MAELSKRKQQRPLPDQRSKIPNLPPAIPYHGTRQEIVHRDINELEVDDDDSGEDDDNDENEDEDGVGDENDNEDAEADEDNNSQPLPRRRGSPVAPGKPHRNKLLQKHRDMKETQQLHSQLSFLSSEASQPMKFGKQLKKREQQVAASEDSVGTEKPRYLDRNSGGTASYALMEKHPVLTAPPASDDHIIFVDNFPDTAQLGNLLHDRWSMSCVEMNTTSLLTKMAKRNARLSRLLCEARRPLEARM